MRSLQSWKGGRTAVYLHTYWVQWGHWNDRPKMIETRWLAQVTAPYYEGRGVGIRIGKRMLSVGVCSPKGLVAEFRNGIHDEAAASHTDWLLQRFGSHPLRGKGSKPSDPEQIVDPQWKAWREYREFCARRVADGTATEVERSVADRISSNA